ncbi:hypothetical protein BBJ28_00014302 [Nothophytophthora sp. Chile5]|nr:hypothetical protein BBJ28_00014302 [Nothophytophthora sp. Chile5]
MITKPVRVLSERIMSRGFEPTVARLMENVGGQVLLGLAGLAGCWSLPARCSDSMLRGGDLDTIGAEGGASAAGADLCGDSERRERPPQVCGAFGGTGWPGVLMMWFVRCGWLSSQWKSQKDYNTWVKSEEHKKCTEQINEVLDIPGKRTTIFKRPEEDIFLL